MAPQILFDWCNLIRALRLFRYSVSRQLSALANHRDYRVYGGYQVPQWAVISSKTFLRNCFHSVIIVVKVLYKPFWLSMELHKNNFILETSMLLRRT